MKKLKHKLFDDVNKTLQEKEDNLQPYNASYIRDILKHINSKIDEKSEELFQNMAFSLTQYLEIDLVIPICGYAIKRLEKLDQRFRESQNPIIKIEKNKEYYFGVFQVNFDKANLESTVASVLLDIIRQGISEKIEFSLSDKICGRMNNITHANILNSKKSLIAQVLISLAEEENFDSYYDYILEPERSIKCWISSYIDEFNTEQGIQTIIEEEIKELIDGAEIFIQQTNKYVETISEDSRNILTWTEKFRELAKKRLIIKNLERVESLGFEVGSFDFSYLKEELCEGLKDSKLQLANKLHDFLEPMESNYTSLRSRVVDKIITSVIGCVESCPFCGEICISGRDNHDSVHETLCHRPRGVTGRYWETNNKLVTETCEQGVGSEDIRFRNADTNYEWKYYKDYREVNDYYASWKINGDRSLEASSYWKWFMANYSFHIAELYDVKEPDIPES